MVLHDFGHLADLEWQRSFGMRRGLELDAFVIMPNHIHAIVTVCCSETGADELNGRSGRINHPIPTAIETHGQETHGRVSLRESRTEC